MASPAIIIAYVPILFAAAIVTSGGWVMMVYFMAPHYALLYGLPLSIGIGALVFALLEGLGQVLRRLRALSAVHYWAALSVLSLALGPLPFQLRQTLVRPTNLLLENYAAGVAFYGILLALMGAVWWGAHLNRRSEKFTASAAARIASLVLIFLPFGVYAIAQTSRLHEAVRARDMAKIESALKPWKSLNGRDRDGSTPLGIAISKHDIEIARFLIARGASVVLTTSSGERIDHLAQAVQYRQLDMVSLLLDGIDKIQDERAAHQAVQARNIDALRLILRKGSPVSRDSLLAAVRGGDIEMVQLLLENGALRNADNVSDRDLVWAAMGLPKTMPARLPMGDLLVRHGVELTAHGPDGRSSLELVLVRRDRDGLQWLIGRGYPVNASDQYGRTALHIAAATNEEMVTLLLRAGAAVNTLDQNGRTPLSVAVEKGHLANALLLLKARADPNAGGLGAKPIEIVNRTQQYFFLGPLRDHGLKE